MKICSLCVLPQTYPGIRFYFEGICNFCLEEKKRPRNARYFQGLQKKLDRALRIRVPGSEYDCVVAFSGGKDSSYTLRYLVKERGLRCLAITIDNGFISETAKKNCSRITAALGVDFQWFSPHAGFLHALYRKSAEHPEMHPPAAITRASVICNSCISLINNYMLVTALQKKIPLIAGGYLGGQVPKDAVALEVNLATTIQARSEQVRLWKPSLGAESVRFFGIPQDLIDRSGMKKVTVVNPMLSLRVAEEEVLSCVKELGWEQPLDTGKNSSNCRLNDLGIAIHLERYGFHPYALELSEQIRAGLMTREKALTKINDRPTAEKLQTVARPLGLERASFLS